MPEGGQGYGPAAVTGLAQMGSSIFGNLIQNRQRKKEYQIRKADNIEFWNMQNKYNDPSAQRKRLEEAGLNPALMYGSGGAGASGAGNSSGISTVDMQPPQWRDPAQGLGLGISSYFDTRIKQAQTDNLQNMSEVNRFEAMFKDQTMGSRVLSAEGRSLSDRAKGKGDWKYYAEGQKEDLRKKQIWNGIDEAVGLAKAQEQMDLMRKQGNLAGARTLNEYIRAGYAGLMALVPGKGMRHAGKASYGKPSLQQYMNKGGKIPKMQGWRNNSKGFLSKFK